MRFRELKEADLPDLARIHQDFHSQGFELPDISKALMDGVVVDIEENVTAYGIVVPFCEVIFIPDRSKSKAEIVTALKLMMIEAIKCSDKFKIRQIHCFIRDNGFSDIMKNHYGFKECTGTPLVLNLSKG